VASYFCKWMGKGGGGLKILVNSRMGAFCCHKKKRKKGEGFRSIERGTVLPQGRLKKKKSRKKKEILNFEGKNPLSYRGREGLRGSQKRQIKNFRLPASRKRKNR